MPEISRPQTYKAPLDSYTGEDYMKVSDIARVAGITPEEVFQRLSQINTAAFSDFSADGIQNRNGLSITYSNGCMPAVFTQGFVPAYVWDQIHER